MTVGAGTRAGGGECVGNRADCGDRARPGEVTHTGVAYLTTVMPGGDTERLGRRCCSTACGDPGAATAAVTLPGKGTGCAPRPEARALAGEVSRLSTPGVAALDRAAGAALPPMELCRVAGISGLGSAQDVPQGTAGIDSLRMGPGVMAPGVARPVAVGVKLPPPKRAWARSARATSPADGCVDTGHVTAVAPREAPLLPAVGVPALGRPQPTTMDADEALLPSDWS